MLGPVREYFLFKSDQVGVSRWHGRLTTDRQLLAFELGSPGFGLDTFSNCGRSDWQWIREALTRNK
jgi:hypothetical protein